MYRLSTLVKSCLFLILSTSTLCIQSWFPSSILDKHGRPNPALCIILNELMILHDNTLDTIVQATQAAWLRPAGKERWQITDPYSMQTYQTIKPHLEELGLVHAIKPMHKQYDYVLLLGATVESISRRIAHLTTLCNAGIDFKEVIILSGSRNLDETKETIEKLLNNQYLTFNNEEKIRQDWAKITTEIEMIQFIFSHARLPEKLANEIKITFINAPKKQRTDGSWTRPTTNDTIQCWLEQNPKKGTCLAISDQPHVLYQQSVLATLLPAVFPVETIGKEAPKETKLTVFLDALTRLLYQEQQRQTAIMSSHGKIDLSAHVTKNQSDE